ncbi:MAG: hypothetical protein E7614_08030 [Ruminococcaceae bacterium]|nr:hypothetical protein [Oscillospiraceae bacterium]
MKKSEMKELVRGAIEPKKLCRMFFKYDVNYRYYFPLQVSDKFFLGAEEDDFIIDGFAIRRFCDLTKVQINDNKCNEIFENEGILNDLSAPEIDLTDWHSVFLSLEKWGKNIIVEKESLVEDEWEFAIGYIEKVLKNKVLFKHFDADGIWQDEPLEIPFSQITTIIFGSRYVDVFSKYV